VKTSSSARRATSSALAGLLVAGAVAGCGGARASGAASLDGTPGVSTGPSWAPVDFTFDSLDARPVSAESTRGRFTVLAFVETGSLPSQAQVDFLVAMSKRDGEQVNYAVVALETQQNRELIEIYRKALGITFPVALADPSTASGGGPFGDVTAVPVTVVLDRAGRVVWRAAGRIAKPEEIRAAMKAP
jgi:hypothetical protein